MGRLLEIAKAAVVVAGPRPVVEPATDCPRRSATPIPADWVAIPGSLFPIDQLYRGVLTGKVPSNWTRVGWLAKTRERKSRTDDPVMRAMLDAEMRAIETTDEKTE